MTHIIMALSSREKPVFRKFYSVRTFARIPQQYLSKYWGSRMHGPPPPQILGDIVPPVYLKSPPMLESQRSLPPHLKGTRYRDALHLLSHVITLLYTIIITVQYFYILLLLLCIII